MMRMDVASSFRKCYAYGLNLGIKMGGVLGAIAALDYLYQRLKHEQDLLMTKQEVKDD
jgi:flagellar biosynthetic protein FlhB